MGPPAMTGGYNRLKRVGAEGELSYKLHSNPTADLLCFIQWQQCNGEDSTNNTPSSCPHP